MKILRYILLSLMLLTTLCGFSKEIIIDADFSTIDIYNTLTAEVKQTASVMEFDVTLINNSKKEQQLYFSIINPTINRIIIYEGKDSFLLGDHIPFTKREFKHTNHVYPLLLAKDSTHQISIKVFNSLQHALNFRLNLATENSFIKTTNHDNFFNGVFYGILFIYLLLLICFYIFSKSNFFTIYLMINVFMLLIFFLYNGTGYQFFWFFSAGIQQYIGFVAVVGYLTMHILFIRTFFAVQLKTMSKFLIRTFLAVLFAFGGLLLLRVYNTSLLHASYDFYFLFINGIFILYAVMVVTISIITYKESGSREILWVMIGMLFHFINWIIFINNEFASIHWLNIIDNFKFFPSTIFVPQLNYLITMLEVFVVTVFISINYHKLIRQNDLSAQRLEYLQKRNINTFVLGKEEEREIITNEIDASIFKDIEQLKLSLAGFQVSKDEKNIIPSVLNEIDKTLNDIKNITGNYVAPDMQQMKLSELITTATDKLFQSITTNYDFSKIPDNFKLNEVANINLYRIFQEISNNTIKHSGAAEVNITAIKDNKTLQLKIKDDGIGFSVLSEKNKGIGLMNIESRMNSLNGNFYLMSNEKKGSTIHLIMNLKDII